MISMVSEGRAARNAVRVWMRQTMDEKGWSAAEWARRANTTPTNITRVLSPVEDICPRGDTIAKLARAAGSQPNLGAYQRMSTRSLPLVEWGDWSHMARAEASPIIAPMELSEEAFAVKLDTDMMNAAGLYPGDILFVEPTQRAVNGRILLAEDRLGNPVIGRVMDPWLVPQSTGKHECYALASVKPVGVALSVVRSTL